MEDTLPPTRAMEVPQSWHIPMTQYRTENNLPLIYLQILPRSSREAILTRVNDYDLTWSHELWQNVDNKHSLEELVEYPYIRDGTFQPGAICVLLERLQKAYRSRKTAVLVDGDVDDDSCIVVSWANPNSSVASADSKLKVSAARVQQSIARPLLSLISSGLASSVEEVLGDQYHESQVDLALDFSHKANEPHVPVYPAPDFLPKDLSLCPRDRLSIVSLTPLGEEGRKELEKDIAASSKDGDIKVEVHDWQGSPPTRGEIYQLYEWLESNSEGLETIDYAFFVDHIVQDAEGRHAIFVASRISAYGYRLHNLNRIEIVPVKPGKAAELWQSAVSERKAREDDTDSRNRETRGRRPEDGVTSGTMRQCGDVWSTERVINPRVAYKSGDGDVATVWFLRDFSIDEERRIRSRLSQQHDYDPSDGCHEFIYMGYPFPDDGKVTHTLEDLRDLWQRGDPYSPFFDPANSKLRFNGYPNNFVAVDERALLSEEPIVSMGSTLDLHFKAHEIGWHVGVIEIEQAYNAWCNLDIANVGPAELFHDEGEVLFLSDLTYFKPGYEAHAEENNGYGGEYDLEY